MFNPLFGSTHSSEKKRNAVYTSTCRRGLDFQSALLEKIVYSTWQILQLSWIFNPLFGYDKTSGGNTCLVARGQSALWKKPCRLFPRAKNWYSWIVNPLCGQMKTWSTHRVAKDLRAACSTHSSEKKRNAVYTSTCRRGLDFQSALLEKIVYSTWQILQLSWIFNPLSR